MSKPRTSRRRLIAAAAALIIAGPWLWAAIELWQTAIPGDIDRPELSPRALFPERLLAEAESYQRFLDITDLGAALALVIVLALFALKGASFVRESAAGRIGTGMLLGMLGLGLVWFAQLPFGLAQLWWQRRHDTAEVGYVEWLVEDWLLVGGQFLFISLALLVVMALAGIWRRRWWLAAAPALAALATAFAFVQPYLIPGLEPLSDGDLAADARLLAEAQGLSDPDVRIQETHGATEAPNAFAAGLGPSRRVVLWDTLVENFDDAEARFVLGHELAHLTRDHIWKRLAWMALLALPVGMITAWGARRRGGIYEPAAVPVAIFAVAVLTLLLSPLNSSFSQRLETEADWVALETARDPDAARSLLTRFTRFALLDPSPPAWAAARESHPSILSRIELAEAWRAR